MDTNSQEETQILPLHPLFDFTSLQQPFQPNQPPQWDPTAYGPLYHERPKREATLRVHQDVVSSPGSQQVKGKKRILNKKKPVKKSTKRSVNGSSKFANRSGTINQPLRSLSANVTQGMGSSKASALFLPSEFDKDKTLRDSLLPAPEGSILDVNNLLILHPPMKPLPTPMLSSIKSPFQQYNTASFTNPQGEPYLSPFEMYTCRICSKTYDGKNSRSVARRHLQDKHGISLENQPRRSRWDYNPDRPKTKEEAEERLLSCKRQWAIRKRQRAKIEKTHAAFLEQFGPKGLEASPGIFLVAPMYNVGKKVIGEDQSDQYQDGSWNNVSIPTELSAEIRALTQDGDSNDTNQETFGAGVAEDQSNLHFDYQGDNQDISTSASENPDIEYEIERDNSANVNKTPVSNTRSTARRESGVQPLPPPRLDFTSHQNSMGQQPSDHEARQQIYNQDRPHSYTLVATDFNHAVIEVIHKPSMIQGQWSITSRPGFLVEPNQVFEAVMREDDKLFSQGLRPDYSVERRLYFAYVSVQPNRNVPTGTSAGIMNLEPTQFHFCETSDDGRMTEEEPIMSSPPPSEDLEATINTSNLPQISQTWVPPLSTGDLQYQIQSQQLSSSSTATSTEESTPISELAQLESWYVSWASAHSTDLNEWDSGDIGTSGDMAVAAESLLDLHSSPSKSLGKKDRTKRQLEDSRVGEGALSENSNNNVQKQLSYGLPSPDFPLDPSLQQPTPTKRMGITRSQTISAFPIYRPDVQLGSIRYNKPSPSFHTSNQSFNSGLDDPFVFDSPTRNLGSSKSITTPSSGRMRSSTNVNPLDGLAVTNRQVATQFRVPISRVSSLPTSKQRTSDHVERHVSDSSTVMSVWDDNVQSSVSRAPISNACFTTPLRRSSSSSHLQTRLPSQTNSPPMGRQVGNDQNQVIQSDLNEAEEEEESVELGKTLADRWLIFSSPAVDSPGTKKMSRS